MTTQYTHARIFTADPEQPWADTLTVGRDGRLTFVGKREDAPDTSHDAVVDLAGAFVMPGVIDGHTHLIGLGQALREVQLVDATGLADIQERVRLAAAARPDAPRIRGNGWLYPALDGRAPHRHLLDEVVPDRPVYLSANDQHSAWVNSAALAELGIDADTPDPIGGRIERDERTGEATGLLIETAALRLMRDVLDATVTDADRDAALAEALGAYVAAGVTGVVDMGLEASGLAALERASAHGALPIRVSGHWLVHRTGDSQTDLAQVHTAVAHAERWRDGRLRVVGIKIMSDGVIDSCTAAMKEPFADGSHPGPIWDRDSLLPVVAAADAAGLQVAIHAIGDEASDAALDVLEEVAAATGSRDRRHRLEHLETVTPGNVARVAELGVTASVQPVHSDPAIQDNWRARLGDERVCRGYPWSELRSAGAVLALGSDAPTAPHHALPNLYIAATRRSALDPTLAPNLPESSLPLEEAITAATHGSAYACRADAIAGRLRAGLSADFVVLDRDPFEKGPDALLDATVLRTVVAGEAYHPA